LRAETAQFGPALELAACKMFGEWLDQVEAKP
jgi:GMP synthase (glutamine-hydrolysing)